jgi:hypothetical protein
MTYVPTTLQKGLATEVAETPGEYWQLVWEGWVAVGEYVAPDPGDDLSGLAQRVDDLEVAVDAIDSATLLARANHTGSQAISTVTGLQGALDASLARANHTGSQAISTVTGLQGALDAKIPQGDVAALDLIADQATYDAIAVKTATTLYLIPE